MIGKRPAAERGLTRTDWLDSRHSFSFADYHDPAHMGFGALRVINDDTIAPGTGFPTHPHRDMEIVTYVIDGALAHKDSTGVGSVIRAGELQRMSAGTGIQHSEFNASQQDPVRLLQIWIIPDRCGLTPGYQQVAIVADNRADGLRLAASRDGRGDTLTIHQDINLYAAMLTKGQNVQHRLDTGQRAWMQVAHGSGTLNGVSLAVGDGAALSDETDLAIAADDEFSFLLFDLA